MGLRGLPAFVQQVKWPDGEKPAEKADFGPEGRRINTSIREERTWLCTGASNAEIYITAPDNMHIHSMASTKQEEDRE